MTLTTTPLENFAVTIIPAAQQAKKDALTLARQITAVASQDGQQDAIAAASIMKGLTRDIEKARKEVKKPVLEAGRRIDAVADAYAACRQFGLPLHRELAADFQREEDRKAAAIRAEEERRQQAQREAEERERRKEQEALARLTAEAERERRAALEKIRQAETDAAREAAQIEADRLAEARAEEARNIQFACQEAEAQRLDAARDRATAILDIAPVKPQGAVVKRTMDYELKDIRALYAARPDLVELKERRAMILAAIAIPNAPAIPGIYVFESTKVQSKAF